MSVLFRLYGFAIIGTTSMYLAMSHKGQEAPIWLFLTNVAFVAWNFWSMVLAFEDMLEMSNLGGRRK